MIGIFDSGLGGLTVLKEIKKVLPNEATIYVGDTARLPYGTKSAQTITRYAIEVSDFLLERGVRVLVIACNTASSIASRALEERYRVPLFEVITPAVEKARRVTKNKRIGVIGTPATVKSRVYETKLSDMQVYSVASPLLVPLIEEGWINTKETRSILESYLEPLFEQYIDTLILACTHYPLLTPLIRDILEDEIEIINPAEELARVLKLFKQEFPQYFVSPQKKDPQFFVTDEPYQFEKLSKMILGREIEAERISL